jgi:hypothetical protein
MMQKEVFMPADGQGSTPSSETPGQPEEERPEAPRDLSDEEIEAWAARERERRQAWLEGPTEDERAAWARSERARRRAELRLQARASEVARLGRHYGRKGQLAAEGALSILLGWTRKTLDELVRAGREWEDEAVKPRRRVPLDDEED